MVSLQKNSAVWLLMKLLKFDQEPCSLKQPGGVGGWWALGGWVGGWVGKHPNLGMPFQDPILGSGIDHAVSRPYPLPTANDSDYGNS